MSCYVQCSFNITSIFFSQLSSDELYSYFPVCGVMGCPVTDKPSQYATLKSSLAINPGRIKKKGKKNKDWVHWAVSVGSKRHGQHNKTLRTKCSTSHCSPHSFHEFIFVYKPHSGFNFLTNIRAKRHLWPSIGKSCRSRHEGTVWEWKATSFFDGYYFNHHQILAYSPRHKWAICPNKIQPKHFNTPRNRWRLLKRVLQSVGSLSVFSKVLCVQLKHTREASLTCNINKILQRIKCPKHWTVWWKYYEHLDVGESGIFYYNKQK